MPGWHWNLGPAEVVLYALVLRRPDDIFLSGTGVDQGGQVGMEVRYDAR